MIPVAPRAISRPAAACPPSIENLVRSELVYCDDAEEIDHA